LLKQSLTFNRQRDIPLAKNFNMRIDTYFLGCRILIDFLGLSLKSKVKTLLRRERKENPDAPARLDNAARLVRHWHVRKSKSYVPELQECVRYVKRIKNEMEMW
jgi:hypothetical protein